MLIFLLILNLDKLIAFHEKHKPLISFGVTNRKTSRNFLFDQDNRLCGWINNKTGEQRISIQKDKPAYKKPIVVWLCLNMIFLT